MLKRIYVGKPHVNPFGSLPLLPLLFGMLVLTSNLSMATTPQESKTVLAWQILALTPSDLQKIGARIYQNEGASKPENLLFWSEKEPFPSLGIAHFIWLPQGLDVPFVQTFPQLMLFSRHNFPEVPIPQIDLLYSNVAPWPNRTAFLLAKSSGELQELQSWLEDNVDIQAAFVVQRFWEGQARLFTKVAAEEREQLETKLQQMMRFPAGLFALIDYANFKGFGDDPRERYQGEGWGLLQVLQRMPNRILSNPMPGEERVHSLQSTQVLNDFIEAGQAVLAQRVALAPNSQREIAWLKGWQARIALYAQP